MIWVQHLNVKLTSLFFNYTTICYMPKREVHQRRLTATVRQHEASELFPHPLFLFLASYFTYRDSLMNDMACGVYLNAVKV